MSFAGGGKHDALKTKLRNLLSSKGVPDDVVQERVNSLLGKVPIDHIAKYKNDKEPEFWHKLKDDASDAKIRLITPAELKAHQASQRKNKSESSQETRPQKSQKPKSTGHNDGATQVDMTHFQADGQSVVQLDASRWGPDQSGLCVIPSCDADRFVKAGVRSCDPLALLIVGPDAKRFGTAFSMPAHLASGEPVVVSAVMLQYGEIPIGFTLQLPTTKVTQMESTVIAFNVIRKFVPQWDDAAQPLNYLGIQVPALRGNNLLAAWSIRHYAKGKVATHGLADEVHGYVRVADQLLPQVLVRSGMAGVFLVPKNESKKRDGRFVAFPMPGKSINEVLSRSEGIQEALGVVKMGEGFGIRCRREHAGQLRNQLSPESAYVEHAPVGTDETLYTLRNVPQVSREELSAALNRLGWQAQAVKSQGTNRWLIAAKTEPKIMHTYMVVNDSIVIVESLNKRKPESGVHMVAREVKVNAVVDAQQGVMCVSTTSRMAEVSAQVTAQVQDQIAAAVEEKMVAANRKIEELTQTIQTVQTQTQSAQASLANDVQQVKDEQSFTRTKLAEFESSVTASNQAVLTQMQSMFQTMEKNMRELVQSQNDSEKRPRVGDVPKVDPFSKA